MPAGGESFGERLVAGGKDDLFTGVGRGDGAAEWHYTTSGQAAGPGSSIETARADSLHWKDLNQQYHEARIYGLRLSCPYSLQGLVMVCMS